MLIKREAIQAALQATSDDNTRYFLHAVQIRPNGSVAGTDGHIALIVSDVEPFPDEDFPVVTGAEISGNAPDARLLPIDVAKALISATPKRRTIPVLSSIRVGINGDSNKTVFAATDLQAPRVAVLENENQTFPVIERVLPAADKPGTVAVTFSVAVLEHLCKAAKALGAREPSIRFDVPTHKRDRFAEKDADGNETSGAVCGAVRVSIKGSDGLSAVGAAMPFRD